MGPVVDYQLSTVGHTCDYKTGQMRICFLDWLGEALSTSPNNPYLNQGDKWVFVRISSVTLEWMLLGMAAYNSVIDVIN